MQKNDEIVSISEYKLEMAVMKKLFLLIRGHA